MLAPVLSVSGPPTLLAGVMPVAPLDDQLLAGPSCGGVEWLKSRSSGDEWIGELLFLLCESPLPPRVELRGDTLPVCFSFWFAVSIR
jgi:hypothetical protein